MDTIAIQPYSICQSVTESTNSWNRGIDFYLVMGGISKNLLPYLIHHKLPSGHKLFTFFSHATYTHSSPKSPENSVSSKSRSSSSKSGPGVEETPQVQFLSV